MLHRSTRRRVIAVFFLVTFLTNLFVPGISFALTAGPTAPEATSFEPVDTTDMVNLATGDLVYNLPLLEVPGPSGGYPLSLSYHAGIQPEVEASWVGLGFTLNPGAISRFVNGYADDHKDAVITDHFYWNGQSRTTYSIGVTVPVTAGASATAGLSFTQDSHHGFSVNPYASGEIQVSPGVSVGVSSNGVGQVSMAAANMIQNQNVVVGLGRYGSATIGKKGVSTSTNLWGPLSLDMSINSKGIKPKLSVAGFEKGASREGKINTESSSITIPVPIGTTGAFLTLGRSYMRKWIDETANVNVNGSLYFPQSTPDYTHMNARGFDTYDLLASTGNAFTNMDPEKNLDGSFADYDHYAVNAQGLTGSIKPYHFYEYLYRQNRNNDGTALTRSVPLGTTGNKPGFRFVNDFSNRFLFEPPAPSSGQLGPFEISMSFPTQDITAGMNGEGYENNILAGSKHIEYFTNNEIVNDLAGSIQRGFIDCNAVDFIRSVSDEHKMADQIGAFRITNESGVTYHFALPAYAFGEYTRTEQITPINGATYHEVHKSNRYAHTWFLTAVTGPDYVDRGGPGGAANGKIDKEDWGYWVEFGYSQWTYHYWWRNPVQGFTLDVDNNFQTFSRGRKEIYYLNYIRTGTHVAVFDKSKRRDGRGMDGLHEDFEHSKSGSFARLDRVFLLQYKDLESLGGLSALNNMDVNRPQLESSSIRSVKFNYDYTLCPNTINSFEDLNETVKHGKLTLNSLEFLGKGGANAMPPVQFGYEEKNPVEVSVSLTWLYGAFHFDLQNSGLQVGDIVRFVSNGNTYYAQISNIERSSIINHDRHRLVIIEGDAGALSNGQVTITETKNPPYNKDKYDMWRLYKSDFIGNVSGEARLTTALSAKSVDVWSLRRIKTMMGSEITIDYEADYYDEVVLNKDEQSRANQQALRIRDVTRLANDKLQIFFYNDGYDLNEVFQAGQEVDVSIIGAYLSGSLTRVGSAPAGCSCPSVGYAHHETFEERGGIVSSVSQQAYSITVASVSLINKMAVSQVNVTDHVTMCGPDIVGCMNNVAGSWPSFIAGGVVFTQDKPKWGGGIRVKKIAVSGLFKTFNTTYNYLQGVTSYEPVSILPFRLRTDYYTGIPAQQKALEYTEASMLHKAASLKRYSTLLAIAREVPGPGVMYKQVEARSSVTDAYGEHPNDSWQKYTFQTLTYDMVSYAYGQPQTPHISAPYPIAAGLTFGSAQIKSVHLNDLTTAVGNIKSIVTYDRAGNPIESTEHTYLHDDYLNTLGTNGYVPYANALGAKFQSQGVVVESFADARVIRLPQGGYTLDAIMSKKRSYPSILTKTRHKNLKTGVETTNEVLGFDFFSGETTRALYHDQYGNAYVHETEPAYRKYPSMGLGMDGRKNMLVQAAADYTYKVNPANTNERIALVSANVQTWSDQVPVMMWQSSIVQNGIWRKQASYSFAGLPAASLRADGLYPVAQVSSFPWSTNDPGPEWQKNIESTRYDIYSHDLEAKDINGNYVATKMSYDQSKVFATASNASYHEFAYSGAEDAVGWMFGGGVSTDESEYVTSASTHTGQKAVVGAPGARAFIYNFAPGQKTYRVSVWATQPAATIAYRLGAEAVAHASVSNLGQAAGWYLLQADIPVTAPYADIEVWCEALSNVTYFDDFRMHPVNAPMTSYVYNQWGELSHILNSNNLFTRFEYDEAGRLKETFRETFTHGVVKVGDVQYQYSSGN